MASQKHTKKMLAEIFCIFECLLTQNPILALNFLDSSRSYGRLLENPKLGASRKLFLPQNDFKTSSTESFPKKHPNFGGLEMNQIHETQTRIFFICPCTYELNVIGTYSKCHKY